MANLILSIVVVALILGGPLTLYAIIKISSAQLGKVHPRLVRTNLKPEEGAPLGVLVEWDEISFPEGINRVRLEYSELVRDGRSTSFSFTFEDRSAKKKSFLIPMKLKAEDLAMLTDQGLPHARRSVERSYLNVEVEN